MKFKKLDEAAKELFLKYNQYVYLNNQLQDSDEDYPFYRQIENGLKSIREDYSFLLRKEYIERTGNYWWQLYYSKSTYYRMKKKAIEALFDCLK